MLPAVGDIISSRYRLESVIGAGGFATVYLATDLSTGVQVALKLLHQDDGIYDRQTRQRFEREARVLRELRDPRIVQLLDHGSRDVLFLVFELVRGEDLSVLLRDGPLDTETAVEILRQLVMALATAHEAGILHRDVKPENIRVIHDGDSIHVKLLDFGIARPTNDGSPSITKTGELVGTPRYMSPEQLTDAPLGPPSDIYPAGIVGLEMLLGRDAMHGNKWMDQLDRLRTGYVFALPGLNQHGVELMHVLNRMTARDVADRYPSARAAGRALDAIGNARPVAPVQALEASRPSRTWRFIAGVAVVLMAAVFAGVFLVRSPTTPTSTRLPEVSTSQSRRMQPPERPQRDASVSDSPERLQPSSTGESEGCGLALMKPHGLPVHTPKNYDPERKYPLIVMLRDRHMSAGEWLERSGFTALADAHGAVVIAPHPINIANPWYHNTDQSVSSIRSAVRSIMAGACIDPGRVYLIAHGHAAALAYRLSCTNWVAGLSTYADRARKMPGCEDFDTPFLLLFPNESLHQRPSDERENHDECEARPRRTLRQVEAEWRSWLGIDQTKPQPWRVPGAACSKFSERFSTCTYDGGHGWPGVPRQRVGGKEISEMLNHETLECDGPPPMKFDPAQTMWTFFSKLESRDPRVVLRSLDGARELDRSRLSTD